MQKPLRKLTSAFLMTTLLGTLAMTNSVEAAHAQTTSSVPAVATADSDCRALTNDEMALLSGTGWVDDLVTLIDLGCIAGSAAAVLEMTSPFVGAFCAGWAIGRFIGG